MAGEQAFRPGGASISGRIIPATFPFYTTGEDNLRIVSFNSAASVKLTLSARLLGVDGRPSPSVWFHTPNTDRSASSNDFPLSGQTLLNVRVVATSGSPLVGQTFVIVQLIRGIGAAAIVLGTVLQGYVTTTQGLGWPGSAIVSSTDGEPAIRTIVGTTPAAGVDILETVPTGARWELLSVVADMTTGAGGAATAGYFSIDDGVNVYNRVRSGICGGAGVTCNFAWSQNVQFQSIAAGVIFNLQPLAANRMLAGHRFSMQNANGAGNKTWSAPVYNVREWLDV